MNGQRHIDNEERERANAESEAWHERLDRFAPVETPPERLRRVEREEKLRAGLKEMLLARPFYGDRACDEIERLLKG